VGASSATLSFTDNKITEYADQEGGFGVAVVDLDGDSDVDILVAAEDEKALCWYYKNGDGSWTQLDIEAFEDKELFTVFAVDVDGDSDVDVFIASQKAEEIWLYLNDGSQNFGSAVAIDDDDNIVKTPMSVYRAAVWAPAGSWAWLLSAAPRPRGRSSCFSLGADGGSLRRASLGKKVKLQKVAECRGSLSSRDFLCRAFSGP